MTGRSQGYLAATACVFGFGACTAPTEHTDLRPDGPPEVLAILASDDPDGAGAVETATFCKAGDDKRPGLVPAALAGPTQVCPDDLKMGVDEVKDTQPVDWYVRIQFDELLNPKIEDLLPIGDGTNMGTLANTQPVNVTCGKDSNGVPVNIAYDGYYDPSGNSFTWPLGPSLVIQPLNSSKIATGTECQVTIKPDVIADKDGNHVPAAELGPYTFKIAPLALVSENPAQPKDLTKPSTIDATKPLVLTFNATMDVTSLDPATVKIVAGATDCNTPASGVQHTAKPAMDKDSGQAIDILDGDGGVAAGDAWLHATTYIVTFPTPTGITVKDAAGGAGSFPDANKLTICFKTAT